MTYDVVRYNLRFEYSWRGRWGGGVRRDTQGNSRYRETTRFKKFQNFLIIARGDGKGNSCTVLLFDKFSCFVNVGYFLSSAFLVRFASSPRPLDEFNTAINVIQLWLEL